MIDIRRLLALPLPLLAMITTCPPVSGDSWHSNLQPHEKYFPEHERQLEHEWELLQRMKADRPLGMQKMTGDPGQKFFLDYWSFESEVTDMSFGELSLHSGRGNRASDHHVSETLLNDTSMILLPPLLPHSDVDSSGISYFFRRALFERDFKCPTGTSSCTSIGAPDSCCETGETCVTVDDSSTGNVGCCPSGETCGGTVATCDTSAGYTSCAASMGGGCCIPGYTCYGSGCVAAETSTSTTSTTSIVSASPTTSTSTTTVVTNVAATTASTTTQTVTVVPAEVTTVVTITSTLTVTPSTSTDPTTVVQTLTLTSTATATTSAAQTCTTGYRTCPASDGGGCCPTDRACGSPTCPPLSTSTSTATVSAVAPVRATSSTIDTDTTTTTASVCPTGFYMCSAYYMGGCCRVDRDCASTDCPSRTTTTVTTGDGVTVVVATTSAVETGTGTCASGWAACAASVGGGCCPSDYVCGSICTATVSGVSDVAKETASSAALARSVGCAFVAVAIAIGGMAVLL